MDENGKIDPSQMPADLDDKKLVEMYKNMLFARQYDAKQLSLQRQGRAVTYAPLLGEEATQIGSAMAMRKDDIFVPAFRQHGVFITRGLPLDILFLYWRGFEEGNAIPKEVRGYANMVPVATQMPHATGAAYAQKYKGTGAAVVAYVGDGGTSEGDFYEAINFAGVWKAPLVVIIENNQWAISIPRKNQTAAQTLAQKAVGAGIRGLQVDGNDVIAVYKATKEAIENSALGPTVIECITYRMGMHTTADDPTKYRNDEEVQYWQKRDPLLRMKTYLMGKGAWTNDMENKVSEENSKIIDAAVEKAEKFSPDPSAMFQHVYSFMPDILKNELDDASASNFWQGGNE
ncbi:MAG: pyruvate dehydrogenase (acetyl-transferring) E1 component subunit alpha [Candidatus Micrarchaeota archaeon]|nr:pyruvate dehydrogenase (acetyl-transferring) E1 component subunit alpha [Candidatus Micrarchaeota archaeon]MDE1833969.1 pyruvate dehydrogenase (acetyl-transferring) E1 component subunit alpha [Candidatus Micrarchaeota archaeon]MDE1859830.1 pyruvate dehydrogenase (acetyl-transferring) E1 component subunit alpha [Candidatus Micrarchaeota archaeon]